MKMKMIFRRFRIITPDDINLTAYDLQVIICENKNCHLKDITVVMEDETPYENLQEK